MGKLPPWRYWFAIAGWLAAVLLTDNGLIVFWIGIVIIAVGFAWHEYEESDELDD